MIAVGRRQRRIFLVIFLLAASAAATWLVIKKTGGEDIPLKGVFVQENARGKISAVNGGS